MYPPPPNYHPQQQYPSNCLNNQHRQSRQQGKPPWNANQVARNPTPLPDPLTQLYQKLWNPNFIVHVQLKSMMVPLQ